MVSWTASRGLRRWVHGQGAVVKGGANAIGEVRVTGVGWPAVGCGGVRQDALAYRVQIKKIARSVGLDFGHVCSCSCLVSTQSGRCRSKGHQRLSSYGHLPLHLHLLCCASYAVPLCAPCATMHHLPFLQVLERKLERERQLSVPAQRGAVLSPGTQRILQRRKSAHQVGLPVVEARQEKEGDVEGGMGQGLAGLAKRPLSAGSAVCASIARGLAGVLELAGMPASGPPATIGEQDGGVGGEATLTYSPAEGDSEGMYTAASDSWQPATTAGGTTTSSGPLQPSLYLAHCTFRPTITERAAAGPGSSPEQLHAEWKARQDKLVGEGERGRGLERGRLHYTSGLSKCSS